ncbi:hypothetical protein RD110_16245 [Rhodoferax koreense]|uniref:Lipocalin/cytosolic fatty-acid binding domain-containing protein n=1 Tax=Rhodoferax koreensis TaxID=1842727 RepID=A0A1P8JXS4_9BURK|nr:lipocalin family protein [Rhodoferax koreense]APW38559.1 hypothetical protein RD110_16245 [Rhodoferax koreense]
MQALFNSALAAVATLTAAASIAFGETATADLALAGARPSGPPVVQKLDLQRYSGAWFEQARLPNVFQRECASDVIARYTPQAGGLKVVNGCRTANGGSREVEGEGRRVAALGSPEGQLEVRFAPRWLSWLSAVWADYWVLEIDPDYQVALVGTPDREYLWLLSRAPSLPQAERRRWLAKAAQWGYAVDKVVLTPQSPDGAPGPDHTETHGTHETQETHETVSRR